MCGRARRPADGPQCASAASVVRVCLHPRHPHSGCPLFSLHPGANRCRYLVNRLRFPGEFRDALWGPPVEWPLLISAIDSEVHPGANRVHFAFLGVAIAGSPPSPPHPTRQPRWAPPPRRQHGKECVDPTPVTPKSSHLSGDALRLATTPEPCAGALARGSGVATSEGRRHESRPPAGRGAPAVPLRLRAAGPPRVDDVEDLDDGAPDQPSRCARPSSSASHLVRRRGPTHPQLHRA